MRLGSGSDNPFDGTLPYRIGPRAPPQVPLRADTVAPDRSHWEHRTANAATTTAVPQSSGTHATSGGSSRPLVGGAGDY